LLHAKGAESQQKAARLDDVVIITVMGRGGAARLVSATLVARTVTGLGVDGAGC